MLTYLTQRFVDNISANLGPVVWYDSELSGFGLLVEPSGVKHWIVWVRLARQRARMKRILIGTTADVAADIAREVASWLLSPRISSLSLHGGVTLLAKMEQLHQDIAKAIDQATADWVLQILSREFGLNQIDKPRHLRLDELGRLGLAIARTELPGAGCSFCAIDQQSFSSFASLLGVFTAAAFKLLLLTLATEHDISHLRWKEVSFDSKSIRLVEQRLGPRNILLNAPALNVLHSIPRVGPFVIVGADPNKPRNNLSRPWQKLAQKATISHASIRSLLSTQLWLGGQIGQPLDGAFAAAKGHALGDEEMERARHATEAVATAIAAALARHTKGPTLENERHCSRMRTSMKGWSPKKFAPNRH